MPDENELMFGGSNSGRLTAYFGNLGCFEHFFAKGKSGRFTGFSGIEFRETGVDSGLDWKYGR
jgi:hypothetical protein